MKKHFWQKLFWIFMGVSLFLSMLRSGFSAFTLSLPIEEHLTLVLTQMGEFLPSSLILSSVLFFCVFLYFRSFVTASDFLLNLLSSSPQSKTKRARSLIVKEKQKVLFYLSHTQNPYLKNRRDTLSWLLSTTEEKQSEKSADPPAQAFLDIVNQVQKQSQSRYPDLKINTDLKADIQLSFFAPMMFQALWELIKNAQQVSRSHVYIRTYQKGHNWFCCEVEDKGPGMNRALMEKASQLHWTTKANSTGLGLPFVQSVLSRVGGIMQFQSPAQGGLKVLLFIPKDYLFHIQYAMRPGAIKPDVMEPGPQRSVHFDKTL